MLIKHLDIIFLVQYCMQTMLAALSVNCKSSDWAQILYQVANMIPGTHLTLQRGQLFEGEIERFLLQESHLGVWLGLRHFQPNFVPHLCSVSPNHFPILLLPFLRGMEKKMHLFSLEILGLARGHLVYYSKLLSRLIVFVFLFPCLRYWHSEDLQAISDLNVRLK